MGQKKKPRHKQYTAKPVKVTKDELLAIFCAGGRNSGERSNALPQEKYQDPAKHTKFAREYHFKKMQHKRREK